jgi:hypothetical protein
MISPSDGNPDPGQGTGAGGGGGGGGGGERNPKDAAPAHEAEIVSLPGRAGRGPEGPTAHLLGQRKFIIRRSLLASAVGGIVPLPVMDDYLAGRIRAGMLMQIAERRRVDLAPSSAELLADPREGSAARNATMTAATLVALKLAWRKVFMFMAAGRRAEEMTTTFQVGTIFDHFCARLQVGAGVDRVAAIRLRGATFAAIRETERSALIAAFAEGGRTLGRSVGEAPAWISRRLHHAVERYVASGGNPDALPRIDPDDASDAQQGPDGLASKQWLDRATVEVESRLTGVGNRYLEALLDNFERHWRKSE